MEYRASSFLKALLACGASAAVLSFSTLAASAHGHDTYQTAAPRSAARTESRAPRVETRRVEAAPRAYAAPRMEPRRVEAAPRTYAVPRTYAAPRRYEAPRGYAAPRHYESPHVYSVPRHYESPRAYAAPRHYEAAQPRMMVVRHYAEKRAYGAPRTYAAPRDIREVRRYRAAIAPRPIERFAPRRMETSPAFVERIQTPRRVTAVRSRQAPFIEYVRAPRAVRPAATAAVARIAYHPAYLTGRVVRVQRRYVILQPPVGAAIPVACACYNQYRPGSYATVPAIYQGGTYVAYPYQVPNNVYYAAAPYYGSWDNDGDENDSDGYYSNAPSYGYDNAPNYGYNNAPYYGNQSPYDNCLWSDNDGDEGPYCTQQNGYYNAYPSGNAYPYGTYDNYGYNNYGYNNYGYGNYGYGNYGYGTPYAMQQVQGLVIAKTGSILMVLGANGLKPIVVDASPAMQNGYAMNGPIAAGQVIDAYGYYSGNTFVATMLE